MKSPFDILEKIDEVNFRWLAAAQDLQSAKFQIEERQALSPGEYVIFDRRTQQIVAKSNSTLGKDLPTHFGLSDDKTPDKSTTGMTARSIPRRPDEPPQ